MALFANTSIPTPTGWTAIDNLKAGDLVFDHTGLPVEVTLVQTYTPQDCYEVEFDDGLTLVGDKRLTFHLQDRKWRNRVDESQRRPNRKFKRTMTRPLLVKTVEELHDTSLLDERGWKVYSVPNCLAVNYPTRDLPVPPYVFGVWFATLTPKGRHWVRDYLPMNKMEKIFRGYGHFIRTKKHKNGLTMFDIRPPVRDSFLFAGLDIPNSLPFYYLDGNVEQRIALLQGLIDGGFIRKTKNSNLYTAKDANYHLLRKVQGLVESLGIKTTLNTPTQTPSYTLKFRIKDNFSVLYGTNRRFVTKITKILPKPCVHIETNGQFLVGEGFIPAC